MSVLLEVNIAPIMETFPRLSNAVRTEKSYFAEMIDWLNGVLRRF